MLLVSRRCYAPFLFSLFTSVAMAGRAAAEDAPTTEAAPDTAAQAEVKSEDVVAPASTKVELDDETPRIRVRGKKNDGAIFGHYRVRIAAARPKFDDGLKFYHELYGNPSVYPSFVADWFAWDWYATLGLSFRMGFYSADGYTAKEVPGKAIKDIEASDIEKDKNGPASLTLIPLQIALTAEMTPFAKKWVVLDGWVGVERLYWQVVRTTKSKSSTALIETAADSDDGDALTNKGWKNASVLGGSVNILLNGIDESSAASMRGSMGLGYIYLSPFIEIVRTTSKDGISFGRSSIGVGFTFESTH